MKSVILIATHKRNNLLRLNLQSLIPQLTSDTTCVILDDCYTADTECQQLAQQYNCQYLHSGKTKVKDDWRMPGYAFNIGVKKYPCDVVMLCCAEIYHINNTVSTLLQPFAEHNNYMVIPEGKWDVEMVFTKNLMDGGKDGNSFYSNIKHDLKVELPFMMAVPYNTYVDIGGYDEDFIGATYDDDDFVDRMKLAGCSHLKTSAKIVHMFDTPISQQHNRPNAEQLKQYNKNLYIQRKGIMKRNVGKEWGQYDH